MTKHFYVVVVRGYEGYTTTVSQEAYPSLAAAQAFCSGRGDGPTKINEFCYCSLDYMYQIHSVYVRGDV